MHFAQPLLGLLALLAVPVILLMYLLKQKYKEKQVPSLYLWEKVLTQTKAQEPWQKLRKNLLMFLQIAAALLLALALSGPYLMGKIQVRDYIIGLDCSLSMQATDVEKSRFDAAKADLTELLENTAPGSRFSLVMLTDTPTLAVSGGEKDVVLRMVETHPLERVASTGKKRKACFQRNRKRWAAKLWCIQTDMAIWAQYPQRNRSTPEMERIQR